MFAIWGRAAGTAVLGLMMTVAAGASEPRPWSEIKVAAKGQTVHWNAWGGDGRINAFIDWVADQVSARYGIDLQHVKLADTGDAVSRVVAEKAAGRDRDGSVDLIWLNGENFAAMKHQNLLHGPWVADAPNFAFVDVAGKPTTVLDFQVPTEGLEAPWGMAQFVFIHDTALVREAPRTLSALSDWAARNPGRFTYPQPPDFIGTSFLKQALVSLVGQVPELKHPVDRADPGRVTAPLWAWLDGLHPNLWRQGGAFPESGPAQRRLLADREVGIAMAFNPAEASSAISAGELPDTVRTFTLEGGTLANTHFVAIPYNAKAREGAMVVANFLMSPEAQVHKQDPRVWGDFTVLDIGTLPEQHKAAFAALPLGVATLSPAELGAGLPEPHPSWSGWLEAEWERRYAGGR